MENICWRSGGGWFQETKKRRRCVWLPQQLLISSTLEALQGRKDRRAFRALIQLSRSERLLRKGQTFSSRFDNEIFAVVYALGQREHLRFGDTGLSGF